MSAPDNETVKALKALKRFGDEIFGTTLRKANGAAARKARDAAKRSTVFTDRTGALRAGIRVSNTKAGTRLQSTAPHSFIVERGHGGPRPAPPHPFLETGIRETLDEQLQTAAQVIRREVRKLHKP